MTSEIPESEDGTTSLPPSRHHCPACGHVTLAPRGAMVVACGGCGIDVDSQRALDLVNAALTSRGRAGEYSRADAASTLGLVGCYGAGQLRDLSDEEIFYRMRELANRVHHLRQVGG
jgi:ribosomal protein S27AE